MAWQAGSVGTASLGMELDGALVCDMADRGSAALTAGVQIGWRVVSVDRKKVPEEDEGVAAKVFLSDLVPDFLFVSGFWAGNGLTEGREGF